jgi:hypothetical protein
VSEQNPERTVASQAETLSLILRKENQAKEAKKEEDKKAQLVKHV